MDIFVANINIAQNVTKKLDIKEVEMTKKRKTRTLCEVYSRIVGYLRPVSQWNPGKEAEFKKRKEYKVK
jgi:hypothetical protein